MAAVQTGSSDVSKEETVYVNTTAEGEVTDVTVSELAEKFRKKFH